LIVRRLKGLEDAVSVSVVHPFMGEDGWEFAARWQPARQVAGDFYDFIPVSLPKDSQAASGLGIVMADVSDKGMPAALFMALSRSIVRASVVQALPPADSITQANRLICADSPNGMFVTLFYAQIDPAAGDMVYVNAGHNPPLLYHADRDGVIRLTGTGMGLGLFDSAQYEQRAARLAPGDFVLMYTDGVTEALDAHGREFGEERLQRLVLDQCAAPAATIASALEQALAAHIGGGAPSDDITFLIARRL